MAAVAIASSFSTSLRFKPLTPTTDVVSTSATVLKLSPSSAARSVPSIYHASSSLFARDHPLHISLTWSALKVSANVTQAVEGEAAEAGGEVAEEEAGEVEDEEEAPMNTKLYFGNLPYNVDSSQLAGIIQEYGSPELVEVLYHRDTGRSRGFAFVTMSSVEDCDAVIQNLDGSEYMGRTLRVNFSDKPKPREPFYPETEFKLFVGNLSWSVTSESLTQAFEPFGNVVGGRVLYDGETGRSRGYGFVSYSTKSDMETALQSADGLELEGRAIRVSMAEGRRT